MLLYLFKEMVVVIEIRRNMWLVGAREVQMQMFLMRNPTTAYLKDGYISDTFSHLRLEKKRRNDFQSSIFGTFPHMTCFPSLVSFSWRIS